MLNVASTESFEVVREQFFRSYLANAVAKGLPPAVVANPAGSVPSENNASTFAEPVLDAWQKSAKEFATALPGICKHYAHFNTAMRDAVAKQIEQALKQPGTPYERVGYVLDWFKEWRLEERKQAGVHPKHTFDTQHAKLQDAMTAMVLNVAYAMIAEDKHAPAEAFHVLRSQPKSAMCNEPTPALTHPEQSCNYTPYPGRGQAKREKAREVWAKNSQKYREQLEHASPWSIVIDWSWKRTLCFSEGNTVTSKTVPPVYTLAKYLLVADEKTWSREHVCDALIMEKTFSPPGILAQSGLDIGLAPRSTMDIERYEAWWKEQERNSAKDWRYIRRNSLMLSRHGSLDNITVGDAVARLRKFGPGEVVNGAFAYEDPEIKALLLERIQPDLGKQYTTLKQVEDSMGDMPDVIIESLQATLSQKQKAHTGPELDVGNLFG